MIFDDDLKSGNSGLVIDPIAKAKEMNKQPKIARFYEKASSGEDDNGQFLLLLDGKKAKTPKRNPIATSCRALSESLAEEWNAQGKHIEPHFMPFTRLINVSIDMDEKAAIDLRDQLYGYLEFDSVTFTQPHPEELIALQRQRLAPILTWVKATYGDDLVLTNGFTPASQPEKIKNALREHLAALTPLELVAMHSFIAVSASLVIGCYQKAHLHDIETSWSAANIEDDWNVHQWGEDEEAQEKRKIRRMDWEASIQILKSFDI